MITQPKIFTYRKAAEIDELYYEKSKIPNHCRDETPFIFLFQQSRYVFTCFIGEETPKLLINY